MRNRNSVSKAIVFLVAGFLLLSIGGAKATTSVPPSSNVEVRNPQPDEEFPSTVVLSDSQIGTLVPDSELPIGRWKFVSIEIFEEYGKRSNVLKATMRSRTPVIMNFERHSVSVGSKGSGSAFSFGPWYKFPIGCTRQFWPYRVAVPALATTPISSFVIAQVRSSCLFKVKGKQLSVYVGAPNQSSADGVLLFEKM
jgi:hypothetical protein